ncbi:MAG TPA: FGGY-family carbohydrate kinase, partial [Clostridia bacterium]|nr:FGGY-family carbohydrate kinase [Clostridia bacterium]
LLVGAALCGGRAYAVLEKFFRAVADFVTGEKNPELYERMNEWGRSYAGNEKLKIRTTFSGTRANPELRGSIERISTTNLTPANMVIGVLEGIADELYEQYMQMEPYVFNKPEFLIGSGNGIRKNTLLQEIFSKKFGMPLRIPLYSEEAANGAALLSLLCTGVYKDISEAQSKIKFK